MGALYKIIPLSGWMRFTNEICGEDLLRMAQDMRAWDKKECDVYGGRLDEILPGRYGKVFCEADNSLIGVWSSHISCDKPDKAFWGWLTTNAVEKHKLDYVRSAKKCVRTWWCFESPQIQEAYISVIAGHTQAEEYLSRSVGKELCECCGNIFIKGIKHSLWRFVRPDDIQGENAYGEVDAREYFQKQIKRR